MKKTLVAILALGGMAMAASDLTYVPTAEITLDTAFVKDGVVGLNSAVTEVLSGSTTNLNLNQLAHGNIAPGATQGTAALNAALTLTEMKSTGGDIYTTDNDKLILNSIQIVSRPNTNNRPTDATITLSNGATAIADYSGLNGGNRGLITFTFAEGVDITGMTELTFSITAADESHGKGFGYTCYQAQSGVTLVGDAATFTPWHMATRLNVTKMTAVPEPATATLSLLALAGLASRRRRH